MQPCSVQDNYSGQGGEPVALFSLTGVGKRRQQPMRISLERRRSKNYNCRLHRLNVQGKETVES